MLLLNFWPGTEQFLSMNADLHICPSPPLTEGIEYRSTLLTFLAQIGLGVEQTEQEVWNFTELCSASVLY